MSFIHTTAIDADPDTRYHDLGPNYHDSGSFDGFVSFECTPDLADDARATPAHEHLADGGRAGERVLDRVAYAQDGVLEAPGAPACSSEAARALLQYLWRLRRR